MRDDPSSSEASALEAAKNFGRRTSLWALAGPKKQTDSGVGLLLTTPLQPISQEENRVSGDMT